MTPPDDTPPLGKIEEAWMQLNAALRDLGRSIVEPLVDRMQSFLDLTDHTWDDDEEVGTDARSTNGV